MENEPESLLTRMFNFIRDIRGPLYDHDMHGWESRGDELVNEYLQHAGATVEPTAESPAGEVPHITVSVEYNGNKVSHHGAYFLDAIQAICSMERAIRDVRCTGKPADLQTNTVCAENYKRPMEGVK